MKKGLFPTNVSAIVIPSVYLAVSILLFVFAAKTGIAKISEQRKGLSEARKTQGILQQKENILRQIEAAVPLQVDILANVLPEKNPALIMISQIKNLAAVSGTTITTFKIGAQNDSGDISFVDLNFDLEGGLREIVSFMNSIKALAPLSTINKAKINQAGGIASANVTIKVYFAGYPTKLPSLTEAASDLTEEEKSLLGTFSTLTLPTFTTLTPQEPVSRENPFD